MTAPPGFNQTPGSGEASARPIQRRIYRSRTNRVFAGVCGGVAEYFGAEPTAVRLLAIVVAVFTAVVPMLVLYLIAAIIVPDTVEGAPWPDHAPEAAAVSPGQGRLVLGIVLLGVGLVALVNEVFRVDWDLLWPAGLILLGGGLVFAARRR
jgi:phage shock protein C